MNPTDICLPIYRKLRGDGAASPHPATPAQDVSESQWAHNMATRRCSEFQSRHETFVTCLVFSQPHHTEVSSRAERGSQAQEDSELGEDAARELQTGKQ